MDSARLERREQTAIVVLALAGGAVLLLGARRGTGGAGAVGLALALARVMVIEGVTYPARYTRAFDVRPLATAVAVHVPPTGIVLGHPDVRLSYDFYVRRQVVELSDPEDVRQRLASAPPDAIIVSAERWRALNSPGADAWRVLAVEVRDPQPGVPGTGGSAGRAVDAAPGAPLPLARSRPSSGIRRAASVGKQEPPIANLYC